MNYKESKIQTQLLELLKIRNSRCNDFIIMCISRKQQEHGKIEKLSKSEHIDGQLTKIIHY